MRICCLTDGKGNEMRRLLTSKKSLWLFFFFFFLTLIFLCTLALSVSVVPSSLHLIYWAGFMQISISISSRGVAALHLMAEKKITEI